MKQSSDSHVIPMTSVSSGKGVEVRPDIFCYTDQIVNLVFIGNPAQSDWILVDAGMPGSGETIMRAAQERFGKEAKPSAILLTHGHFDHVGSIVKLLEEWGNIPVYAHPDEFPFLTGKQDYPSPDSAVEGGGMLAKISKIYPHKAIDIHEVLSPLPVNGSVPGLPDWTWFATPGHSTGHVSFFRSKDRFLIAGDAFVTVKADEFYKVLIQKEEIHGPPVYLTTDWDSAKKSVQVLEQLDPDYAITGHGSPMHGELLKLGLARLSREFDTYAKPKHGKFIKHSSNYNAQ